MLKDYLKERSKQFVEKLVDQDDLAREEMMKKSAGYLGVPFTVIIKDDGVEEAILGFDKGKFETIFG